MHSNVEKDHWQLIPERKASCKSPLSLLKTVSSIIYANPDIAIGLVGISSGANLCNKDAPWSRLTELDGPPKASSTFCESGRIPNTIHSPPSSALFLPLVVTAIIRDARRVLGAFILLMAFFWVVINLC